MVPGKELDGMSWWWYMGGANGSWVGGAVALDGG